MRLLATFLLISLGIRTTETAKMLSPHREDDNGRSLPRETKDTDSPLSEEPEMHAEEPVPLAEEPELHAEEPVAHAEEPVAHAEESVAHSEEPEMHAEEPVPLAEEPELHAEEPELHAEEPELHAEESIAHAEELPRKPQESLVNETAPEAVNLHSVWEHAGAHRMNLTVEEHSVDALPEHNSTVLDHTLEAHAFEASIKPRPGVAALLEVSDIPPKRIRPDSNMAPEKSRSDRADDEGHSKQSRFKDHGKAPDVTAHSASSALTRGRQSYYADEPEDKRIEWRRHVSPRKKARRRKHTDKHHSATQQSASMSRTETTGNTDEVDNIETKRIEHHAASKFEESTRLKDPSAAQVSLQHDNNVEHSDAAKKTPSIDSQTFVVDATGDTRQISTHGLPSQRKSMRVEPANEFHSDPPHHSSYATSSAILADRSGEAVYKPVPRKHSYGMRMSVLLVIIAYSMLVSYGFTVIYRASSYTNTKYFDDSAVHCRSSDQCEFLDAFNRPSSNVQLHIVGYRPGWTPMTVWQGKKDRTSFHTTIDVSEYVEDSVGDMACQDVLTMQTFLNECDETLHTLRIKKTTRWDHWESLALNIKAAIRRSGFDGAVDIHLQAQDEVVVHQNDQWSNFLIHRYTKMLIFLSGIGVLWYFPYMHSKKKEYVMESKFKVNKSISEFWNVVRTELSKDGFHPSIRFN